MSDGSELNQIGPVTPCFVCYQIAVDRNLQLLISPFERGKMAGATAPFECGKMAGATAPFKCSKMAGAMAPFECSKMAGATAPFKCSEIVLKMMRR